MSGGVDSSVAAWLMQQEGYEVSGITLKLYNNEDLGACIGKTCCSQRDAEDAAMVADRLGVPHYVLNYRQAFIDCVISRFIDAYCQGETPNPCIDCNKYIKFGRLCREASSMGFDHIATGHYARIEHDAVSGRWLLRKGVSAEKDQSYVLYSMTQQQLAMTLLPLGALSKPQVRAIAEAQGFVNAGKRESQDICFVPDGDYATFIEENADTPIRQGNFVTPDGKILGKHKGIIHYTVGQRKGLGLALGYPAFVLEIRPETDEVVIGTYEESLTHTLRANELNFMSVEDLTEPMRVFAKIRYNHKGAWCTVEKTGEDEITCTFDEPIRAVTPGQAVVLYDGEYVLGGGTIL